MDLEQRQCDSCKRSFKVLKGSAQRFCSNLCKRQVYPNLREAQAAGIFNSRGKKQAPAHHIIDAVVAKENQKLATLLPTICPTFTNNLPGVKNAKTRVRSIIKPKDAFVTNSLADLKPRVTPKKKGKKK
jgi:hypothetical protein